MESCCEDTSDCPEQIRWFSSLSPWKLKWSKKKKLFHVIHLHIQTESPSSAPADPTITQADSSSSACWRSSPPHSLLFISPNDILLLQNHIIQMSSWIFMMRYEGGPPRFSASTFLLVVIIQLNVRDTERERERDFSIHFSSGIQPHQPTNLPKFTLHFKSHKCCACGSTLLKHLLAESSGKTRTLQFWSLDSNKHLPD